MALSRFYLGLTFNIWVRKALHGFKMCWLKLLLFLIFIIALVNEPGVVLCTYNIIMTLLCFISLLVNRHAQILALLLYLSETNISRMFCLLLLHNIINVIWGFHWFLTHARFHYRLLLLEAMRHVDSLRFIVLHCWLFDYSRLISRWIVLILAFFRWF